jgi:hypothetical protein
MADTITKTVTLSRGEMQQIKLALEARKRELFRRYAYGQMDKHAWEGFRDQFKRISDKLAY